MHELPVDGAMWQDFVASRADACVFHHPSWALLLAECYGFRPFALALYDDAGTPVGGIPVLEIRQLGRLRWASQPFTDVSGPLVDSGEGARLLAGLDRARIEAGVRRLEIRGAFPGAEPADWTAVTHTVPLAGGPDGVLARTKRNIRKNLATAERAGLTVAMGESERDVTETFYALQLSTRRKLGVPIQPRRWYRLLWRRIVEPGLGFLLLVQHRGRPIAGGVFLAWNGVVTAKYSASDPAALSLRPNNLLFWEAIKYGCATGSHSFDFGRTDSHAEGLREFKRAWGSVEAPLPYTVLGEGAAARRDGVSAGLSSSVIRHSPRVVTRAIGELLYRYAA